MSCDFDSYPYRVTTYARQMIIRGSNITERSLVTRCRLQSTVRSDNNPQASLRSISRFWKTGTCVPWKGNASL